MKSFAFTTSNEKLQFKNSNIKLSSRAEQRQLINTHVLHERDMKAENDTISQTWVRTEEKFIPSVSFLKKIWTVPLFVFQTAL